MSESTLRGFYLPLLLLLLLVEYSPSFQVPFQYDDRYLVRDNQALIQGETWSEKLSLSGNRPLFMLSFYLNYLAAGNDPLLYHVVNLLLHAGNILLIYSVLSWVGRLSGRAGLPPWSWWGIVVWALHPGLVNSVTFLASRATLLATFFLLVSFRLWLGQRILLAGMAFLLAMGSKETAWAYPAWLCLWTWYERRALAGSRVACRGRWSQFPFWGVVVAVAAGYHLFRGGIPAGNLSWHYFSVQVLAWVWYYARLFAWPVGQSIDPVFLPFPEKRPWLTLATFLLVLGFLAVAWFRRRERPGTWLAVAGFLVWLAPDSSFFPQADLVYERRLYLPALFLALSLGSLLASLRERYSLAILPILLLPLLYVAWGIHRNRVWQDPIRLWTEATRLAPCHSRPYHNLGVLYQERKEWDRSKRNFRRAAQLFPGYAEAWNLLGVSCLETGEVREAEYAFRRALLIRPGMLEAWNNYGNLLSRSGKSDKANRCYRRALELRPDYEWSQRSYLFNLAGMLERETLERPEEMVLARSEKYFSGREWGQARRGYAHCLSRLPFLEPWLQERMAICSYYLGDGAGSYRVLAELARRFPYRSTLCYGLFLTSDRLGRKEEAWRWLERAARLDPSRYQALFLQAREQRKSPVPR